MAPYLLAVYMRRVGSEVLGTLTLKDRNTIDSADKGKRKGERASVFGS